MRSRGGELWPQWEEYKAAILSRFGSKPFDDPLADLMKLKQTGSVEVYQENFDSLLSRVDLATPQAISCFLSGLTEEVQNAVRMFKPQTLHDAYCLAKLQEATVQSMARKTRPLSERTWTYAKPSGSGQRRGPPYSNSSHFSHVGPSSTPSKIVSASSTGSVSSRARTIKRSVSSKDIEERRSKNLCFLCAEPFFPGHKYKAQVYSLEVRGD